MKKSMSSLLKNLVLIVFGIIFIYPLIWLFTASFKSNDEIFGSIALLPTRYDFNSFVNGWKGSGQYGFDQFYVNTFKIVLPTLFFTIISSVFVAYGFARFRFRYKKQIFALMLSTLMLPNAVVMIPKYIIFNKLGWVDSYLPFIVPAIFGSSAFFIFMLIQFYRGIPRELDESAIIDGCNSFSILTRIIIPLSKPAIFSVGIFQFMWTWNDFLGPLIYVNSVRKFPLALGLRMSLDIMSNVHWNEVIAMSFLSILPPVLIFFFAQKHFVEGIATTGLKG